MATIYEERYNYHPEDFKKYDTDRIRKEFLVEKVMDPGNIRLVYSVIERYIVGGAVPVEDDLVLEAIRLRHSKAKGQLHEAEVVMFSTGLAGNRFHIL